MTHKLIALTIGLLSLYGFGQEAPDFCQQISALQTQVKTNHYAPKTLNDSVSKSIFNLFLDQLDNEKDLLIQDDVDALQSDIYKFDDYLADNNCDFITKYSETLNLRIQDIKSKLEALKTVALDYSGKVTLQYKPATDYIYYKNEQHLNKSLQKRVSYKVISKLLEDEKDIALIKKNFKALEAKAKLYIIDSELCLLDEITNKNGGLERFVKEAFLNALIKVNDPNSSFFNSTEKITYSNSLSKNKMSFGIITSKNKDSDIVINYVIPGSAAFKNGTFEKGAVLKALSTPLSHLNIECISNSDIELFLNKEAHKTVTFSVKNKNGTLQEITLSKSEIKVYDNAVRGYLINETAAIGYIKIPSFYTNTESPNGRGLSADIAKELYKLQKEHINGLILDLRFNGGGSMQEAIDLSGMFIDRGPVAIIKTKTGEQFSLRDPKRGSFYKKPLLILVNEYSASASELFSAAMQDYNRAIIVGSKTYGKSSAQRVFPLDENTNLGFSKITIETFYRVTGKSHQSIGVIPDIILPSLYDNFKNSEKHKHFALTNDSITAQLKHRPLPVLQLDNIVKNSENRVSIQPEFKEVKKANSMLYAVLFSKGTPYPLSLDSIKVNKAKRRLKMNTIFNAEAEEQATALKITNTKSTQELLEYSTEDKAQNEAQIQAIAKDIYIKEAQLILTDYLNLNQ